MSFPRYPEYKDSGVEWLGEVPAHWESWKISHAFGHIGSGTTPPSNEAAWYDEGEIPWVTTGELRENVITSTAKGVTREAVERFGSLRIYPPGSLVVAMYGATIGRLGVLGIHAATNQACCVLASPASLAVRFVFHWLSAFKERLIDLYAYGGGQPNISQEVVASLRIPAPSIEEQLSIATFLDRETAKIDALVAEQQNLIALLKEKRQALISHAVTKGLDPDVLMKDSGVAWLGEVPAHWDVTQLQRVVVLQRGHDLPSDAREEGGVPVVSSGGITGWHNKAQAEGPGIVTGRYGTIGQFDYIETAYWPLNTTLYSVMMFENKPRFVWYMLQALAPLFLLNSNKSAVPGVDRNDIHPLSVVQPPLTEQAAIAHFLDAETLKIDGLTTEAESTIALLQERRTALIAAAVTGKIDVRHLAATSTVPTPEPA